MGRPQMHPKLDELMVLVAVAAANESGNGYDLTVLKKHAAEAAKLWSEQWSEQALTAEMARRDDDITLDTRAPTEL